MAWRVKCPSGWHGRVHFTKESAEASLECMAASARIDEQRNEKPSCLLWRDHEVVEATWE